MKCCHCGILDDALSLVLVRVIFFTTNLPVPSETVITRKILIAALFHLFLPVKKEKEFKFGFFSRLS